MRNEELDIFVEDMLEEKKYLISVPTKIKCIDLKKKLELLFETKYFEFRYKDKLYKDEQILTFEQGETILVYKKQPPKDEIPQVEELNKGFTINIYSGILRLCLAKFIADKISDLKLVKNNDLENINLELKMKLELYIDEKSGIIFIKEKEKENYRINIISFTEYICSVIGEKEINYLLKIFDEKITKEIYKFSNILSNYESFLTFFDKELIQDLNNSYLDYSINGIQLLPIKNNKEYFEQCQNCKNKIIKYLYHEINPNFSKNINMNIDNILFYSKKPYYGMGIYFSDKLDYIAYRISENNIKEKIDEIIPISDSFTCNVSQIYYDNNLKKNITDFKYSAGKLDYYPTYEEINKISSNKKVKKNGINIAKVKSDSRQIITPKDINIKIEKGQFITNEYIITEKEQILPLFNLYLNRNDYLIVWRDKNFDNKIDNSYSKFIQLVQKDIIKDSRINAHFVINIEDALEIVKKKRFNKIILISNIGLDLSGKKFVEIARQILGFPAVVFFFSVNKGHLKWIQEFPNALFSGDINLLKKYIRNYNKKGLFNIKKEIENKYQINLKFTDDFISFPKYIHKKDYKQILYEEICPNFKKVIIKNIKNSNALYFSSIENICFKQYSKDIEDNNPYIWIITIIGDQITLFSHNFYLMCRLTEKRLDKSQYMEIWNFKKHQDYYLIYYKDETKILTDEKNNAIVQTQNGEKYYNQLFSLSEI